jgi:thioredoxin-dependent peroxiredoxin
MRALLASFALTLAFAVAGANAAESAVLLQTPLEAPLAVGDEAPDFALLPLGAMDVEDQVSLAKELETGPVVLLVLRGYPGYQCPACSQQVAQFVAKAKALKAAGAQVLLVYPGPSDQLQTRAGEFLGETKLPPGFTLLIDPDYDFTTQYGLRWDEPSETAYPSTFVIDTEGVVKFAQVSKSHGGRADVTKVLEALNE